MGRLLEGKLDAGKLRVGIVVARFNEFISKELLGGAMDCLKRHGTKEEKIDVAWVPGSFEISVVAKKMAASKKYDAVICLGAIIRGGTPHFDYLAAEVTKGIAQVAVDSSVAVVNGIITTDTLEQAIERAGTKAGNKGFQAAQAAIELANLLDQI